MSERLPRIEGRDLVQALKRAGFVEGNQRGSHLHLRRDSDGKRTTVPLHRGRTLPVGTLEAILRDAGISADDLRQLL